MPNIQQFRLADSLQSGGQAALTNAKFQELGRSNQVRQSLSQAVTEGTPQAMQQFRGQFPIEARQFDASELSFTAARLTVEEKQLELIGRLASGVTDETSYQQAIARAKDLGIEVGDAPPNYDPNFIKQLQNQALTMKDRIKLAKDAVDEKQKEADAAEKKRHNIETEATGRRTAGAAEIRANAARDKINEEKRSPELRRQKELEAQDYPKPLARAIAFKLIQKVQSPLGLETLWINLAKPDEVVASVDTKGKITLGPGYKKLVAQDKGEAAHAAAAGAGAAGRLPPGLPPGSKQIGTSGGRPVYETPDGQQLTLE